MNDHVSIVDCYRNPNTNVSVGADRRVRPERFGDPAAITKFVYASGVASIRSAIRNKSPPIRAVSSTKVAIRHKFRVGADRRGRPERFGNPTAITNSVSARDVA